MSSPESAHLHALERYEKHVESYRERMKRKIDAKCDALVDEVRRTKLRLVSEICNREFTLKLTNGVRNLQNFSDDDDEDTQLELNNQPTYQNIHIVSSSSINASQSSSMQSNDLINLRTKKSKPKKKRTKPRTKAHIAKVKRTRVNQEKNRVKIQSADDQWKVNILGIKCSECDDMLSDRAEWNQHLKLVHNLLPLRCLAIGCDQRFDDWDYSNLGSHIKYKHADITEWICPICSRTLSSHSSLSSHYRHNHQEGRFTCIHADCPYEYTTHDQVHQHNYHHHHNGKFTCDFPNCNTTCKQKGDLKRHKLIHLGVKRFRCSWPGCDFATEERSNVVKHVRGKHFQLPITVKQQLAQGIVDERDPSEFVVTIPLEEDSVMDNDVDNK